VSSLLAEVTVSIERILWSTVQGVEASLLFFLSVSGKGALAHRRLSRREKEHERGE
jgi:hypothetical protein